MNRWVEAARPRTLPLAVASILLGNLIAFAEGNFSGSIAALAILTTLLLQILSNFANDLGDTLNGLDNQSRQVAQRTVQTGKITIPEMKNAVILLSILSFISGVSLIYISLGEASLKEIILFLSLGLLAILAAITYTIGKKPYGYIGLGDLSVFLFFGWVGTCGSYYLQVKSFDPLILLPASAVGLLSVAVLNLNNLRDLENDQLNGKNSVPVRIGKEKGFTYQKSLYYLSVILGILYLLERTNSNSLSWICLVFGSLPAIRLASKLNANMSSAEIDPYLKKTALSTLWFILCLGMALQISKLV